MMSVFTFSSPLIGQSVPGRPHIVTLSVPNDACFTFSNPVIGQSVPGGAHIVTPPTPNGAGLCETDIIYKPTTGAKSQRICVKAMGDNNGSVHVLIKPQVLGVWGIRLYTCLYIRTSHLWFPLHYTSSHKQINWNLYTRSGAIKGKEGLVWFQTLLFFHF